jgi:hypothetical protein
VALDEFGLDKSKKMREARDLFVRQSHLSRPTATVRASLAFMKDRHG